MGNRYYQDRSVMDFTGDGDDRQPKKGQPNKFGGGPVRTNTQFTQEYVSQGDTYSNERKK